ANDVWYTFVATSTTQTLRLVSGFDGVVQAFSGTCGNLTSLGCADLVGSGTEVLPLYGLTVGTRYYARVYAYTAIPVFGTFTLCAVAPDAACNAPTNLTITNSTGTQATLTFTPNLTGGSYTLTTSPATTTRTVTTSPVTLTGLTAGTTYTVSLVGNCSNGAVLSPVTLTFVSQACAAPTGIVASNLSGTSTYVSFTPSTSATSYTVTTIPATTTSTVTASPFTLTGLTPNTAYTVRIQSNCGAGATATGSATFTSATALASVATLEAGQVSIAPNPAHGSFVLLLPAVAGQRTVQATLLNVLGQAVATRSIALTASGASTEFDVRGLSQGVYILRLAAGDQTLTRRVTVE
ncbi:MAG: T9SS type A sorting domain-containing protein, partial [Hymenobacter sp.]